MKEGSSKPKNIIPWHGLPSASSLSTKIPQHLQRNPWYLWAPHCIPTSDGFYQSLMLLYHMCTEKRSDGYVAALWGVMSRLCETVALSFISLVPSIELYSSQLGLSAYVLLIRVVYPQVSFSRLWPKETEKGMRRDTRADILGVFQHWFLAGKYDGIPFYRVIETALGIWFWKTQEYGIQSDYVWKTSRSRERAWRRMYVRLYLNWINILQFSRDDMETHFYANAWQSGGTRLSRKGLDILSNSATRAGSTSHSTTSGDNLAYRRCTKGSIAQRATQSI